MNKKNTHTHTKNKDFNGVQIFEAQYKHYEQKFLSFFYLVLTSFPYMSRAKENFFSLSEERNVCIVIQVCRFFCSTKCTLIAKLWKIE